MWFYQLRLQTLVHAHANARQFRERKRDSSACIGHSCGVEKNKSYEVSMNQIFKDFRL